MELLHYNDSNMMVRDVERKMFCVFGHVQQLLQSLQINKMKNKQHYTKPKSSKFKCEIGRVYDMIEAK